MTEGYTIPFLGAERVISKFLTGGNWEQAGLLGMLSEQLMPLKCYKFKGKQKKNSVLESYSHIRVKNQTTVQHHKPYPK